MTESAVLRLEPLAVAGLDAALCRLSWVRLERNDAGMFLECPSDQADDARALLARCGVRAERRDAAPERAQVLAPALASDLAPFALSGVVDRVSVRVIDTGEAATRLLTRSRLRRARPDAERLRAVLRGEDRMYAWRRVVWTTRSLLRSHELRGARPIVFDREAIENGEERWSSAATGQLTRWLRA